MLSTFWNSVAIIVTIGSILACWWLLLWTKGISDREEGDVDNTGHVWDNDLYELNNPLPRWWLHLFNITIVFAFIYLALYPGLGNIAGTLGWTQDKRYQGEMEKAQAQQSVIFARYESMTTQEMIEDEQAMDTGRRLFGQNCSMCHGSDGGGAYGFPNLTDQDWQWGEGYDNILTAITHGRQAAMPPWSAALGPDGVNEVTEYVMQLSGQEADAALAASGQQKFTVFCVACHGGDGTGNPIMGAPNLTDDIWMYRGDRPSVKEGLEFGRNGKMPSFQDQLSDDYRRILAAYVLGLSQDSTDP